MVHFIKSRVMAIALALTLLIFGIFGGAEWQVRFITAFVDVYDEAKYGH